jgi:hypothetical protein
MNGLGAAIYIYIYTLAASSLFGDVEIHPRLSVVRGSVGFYTLCYTGAISMHGGHINAHRRLEKSSLLSCWHRLLTFAHNK